MKILRLIGMLIFVLLVATGVMFSWFIAQNNRAAASNPIIYGQNDEDAKKALIVYQPSRSGITDRIANAIAEELNESGYYVYMDHPGDHLPINIAEYKVVMFGSPVYVGRPSGALLTYMQRAVFDEKQNIYLFVTGGVKDSPEWESMENAIQGKAVAKDRKKFLMDADEVMIDEAMKYGKYIADVAE